MDTADPFTPSLVAPVDQLGRAATAYARLGIPVLPLHYPVAGVTAVAANPGPDAGRARWSTRCSCRRRECASIGKHPIGELAPSGLRDATTNLARITAWWAAHPLANIGLVTGHRFDVLDVDGSDGAASIRRFATDHELASTGPLVRTGSGGWHYYLAPTGLGNRDPRGLDHVDWRGRGGYVVAPPSRHASGQPYRFVRDLTHPPPEVPAALRARLEPERAAPTGLALRALPPQPPRLGHPYGLTALERECDQVAALAPDSRRRNHTLYLAGLRLHSLAAGGVLDHDDVTAHLLQAARRCGLGDQEAARTIASARDVAAHHPRAVPDRGQLPNQQRARPRPRQPRARGSKRPPPREADRER